MGRNQIRNWKQIRASKVSSGTQAGPHNKCRHSTNAEQQPTAAQGLQNSALNRFPAMMRRWDYCVLLMNG